MEIQYSKWLQLSKRIWIFDYDGVLGDDEEMVKLCKWAILQEFNVYILTSRISGLESASFISSEGCTIESAWGDRFGIKYKDLDQYSDIYETADKIGLPIERVLFTEGAAKGTYLAGKKISKFILFDDSPIEIAHIKKTSPDGISILTKRNEHLAEHYITLI